MTILQIGMFVLATAAPSARPVAAAPDACHVLTKRDVAAVQGEAWSETKLTSRGEVSQCFYRLPAFVNSISVDVIRDGKEFWEERFMREEDEEHERESRSLHAVRAAREEEEEEEARPPRRIAGIGDEAFWAGSRIAGSLYVRKGDSVLRVSVGGKGTEEEKIARSKKLAARALRRL